MTAASARFSLAVFVLVIAGTVLNAQTLTLNFQKAKADAAKASADSAGDQSQASGPSSNVPQTYVDGFYIAKLEHDVATFRYIRVTYWWQFTTSIVLTGVVLAIVGFGLYLSYRQFLAGSVSPNTLKISASGVEISSSVIGLVILAVSLGFFYEFLRVVYPITVTK